MTPWTLHQAVELCTKVEQICPAYGCHVALTGGCLYKSGPRKDADLLFYRIRQADRVDVIGLIAALKVIGIEADKYQPCNPQYPGAWVIKARYGVQTLDLLFPDPSAPARAA